MGGSCGKVGGSWGNVEGPWGHVGRSWGDVGGLYGNITYLLRGSWETPYSRGPFPKQEENGSKAIGCKSVVFVPPPPTHPQKI